ncbi:cytoplasmic protein [Zooshikella ganghwensis]|uniref:cytoplasmic protein n=1 Tax=Zooshikella ganghwensis TaxID=202772 RepID=UPI001BAE7E19|nr:cytoplasmic protein [Zooshikella ganghwensis]
MEKPKITAHKVSIYHREQVLNSEVCGCFHCTAIFTPDKIVEWTDFEGEVGRTALCPECTIDSVIGSKSGYPITKEFLCEMRNYWFF